MRAAALPPVTDLKAAVSFKALVQETHEISRDDTVSCPVHSEKTPSFHIYSDHGHCFGCGWHADHVTWLEAVYGLSTAEAIAELRRRTTGIPYSHAGGYAPRLRRSKAPAKAARADKYHPVATDAVASHMHRAARLDRIPKALSRRGFTLEDARALRMARERDDLLFIVPGPDGTILAIKRRRAYPRSKTDRYVHKLSGHGSPAWCSPKFLEHNPVLVVKGELNGMACWLARPDLAVMGTAGANGGLHLDALRDRVVYIYADNDAPGDKARERWARAAHSAEASRVYLLEPWEADACDIAGTLGRDELTRRLS